MDAVCCNNDMMCESVVLVIVNLPPVYEIFVAEVRGNKKGGKSVFAMRYKYNLYAGSVCEYWAKVRMTSLLAKRLF